MQNRIERRLLLAGLAAALSAGRHASAAQTAGQVETSRGECYARIATERRALAAAAPVFVGDAVGTGVQSALAMQLGTATQVKPGGGSATADRSLPGQCGWRVRVGARRHAV